MNVVIRPIETLYKGYRFRSRLEARWAVFFDACGLDWEYEPEGFDLGDLGWYLPDFKLNNNTWIEIKPTELGEGIYIKAAQKIQKLVDAHEFDRGLLIAGTPWPGTYIATQRPHVATIGVYDLMLIEYAGIIDLVINDHIPDFVRKLPKILDDAFIAARSARFEHGAKG